MLGRVCVPLLVRGFRVGYLWVQLDADEPGAASVLTQLPEVAREVEQLSALLLDSNTAESEFRRRREQEFLAACRGESNAVAAVAGWKEVQGRGPWQLVTVLDADGWAEGIGPHRLHPDPPLRRPAGHHRRGRGPFQRRHRNPRRGAVQGIHRPGEPRPGPGPLPAGTCQTLRPAGPPDHPRHVRGLRQTAGTGRGLPAVAAGGPGRGGGSPAGRTRRLPRHRASTSCWPPPAAAPGPGRIRARSISASWRTRTGTGSSCPSWSCSMTTTARSRRSPTSCTCTGAASTTGWAGSASCWAWIR